MNALTLLYHSLFDHYQVCIYTWREVYRATLAIVDEETSNCVHALKLPHVYNLFVHHKLYERGKAAYAPVIEMPPQDLLNHPSFAALKPETVSAMWFGYSAVREVSPRELESSLVGAFHFFAPGREVVK